MLDEGLVGSIANLSKISDSHISNLCGKILNHLSRYLEARMKMSERQAALHALFKLTDASSSNPSVNAETQQVHFVTKGRFLNNSLIY